MKKSRWNLTNSNNGDMAKIELSDLTGQFILEVLYNFHDLVGSRGQSSRSASDRGYYKSLKGAKIAATKYLGYKSEWKEERQ